MLKNCVKYVCVLGDKMRPQNTSSLDLTQQHSAIRDSFSSAKPAHEQLQRPTLSFQSPQVGKDDVKYDEKQGISECKRQCLRVHHAELFQYSKTDNDMRQLNTQGHLTCCIEQAQPARRPTCSHSMKHKIMTAMALAAVDTTYSGVGGKTSIRNNVTSKPRFWSCAGEGICSNTAAQT